METTYHLNAVKLSESAPLRAVMTMFNVRSCVYERRVGAGAARREQVVRVPV